MAARKHSGRKIRLLKKQKQTSPVPAWVILRTNKTVRTNPKRRAWRQTDVEVVRCLRMLNGFIQLI